MTSLPMSTQTIADFLEGMSNKDLATILRLENGTTVSGSLEMNIDGDDMAFEVNGEQFFPVHVEQVKIADGCVISIALYEEDSYDVEQAERNLADMSYRADLMGASDGPDW